MLHWIVLYYAACHFVYEQLLRTLSDPVGWALQGWWHQRMGVAILISSSLSPVCAEGQILTGPVTQHFCRHNEIFLCCLLLSSESSWWRSEFEVLYDYLCASFALSFFNNFLETKNVLIFLWCCHLISAKINFHGSGYLLLLPLSFSFKKQAVIFNQWVINYWGCAGWQDTRPVLFAR